MVPMPSRVSKKPTSDPIASTFDSLQRIIDQTDGGAPPVERPKNPAGVALSKLGASTGGRARANAPSTKKRKAIATKAAAARAGEK